MKLIQNKIKSPSRNFDLSVQCCLEPVYTTVRCRTKLSSGSKFWRGTTRQPKALMLSPSLNVILGPKLHHC